MNADAIELANEPKQGCIAVVVQADKLYIEPPTSNIDTGVQKEQMQKELDYLKGFLTSIDKKLGNERFVQKPAA